MSQTLILELPDEVFAAVRQTAEAAGTTPAEVAASMLRQRFGTRNGHAPSLSQGKPKSEWTEEEKQAARTRLRRHIGAYDSGDPNFSDNEHIDADLARAYADTHEPET